MKPITLTFCGNRFNKLIAEPNEEILEMIRLRRERNPNKSFRLPTDSDFHLISCSKEISKMVKFGVETKCIVKLTNYDFKDEKTQEQITGAYLQLIAVFKA